MSSNTGEPKTHSVKPYTKSDLASISLPNVIRDYTLTAAQKIPVNPLVYLYPDIPKDDAFGHYYISSSDGRYSLFNHSFIQKRRQDKSVKLKQQMSICWHLFQAKWLSNLTNFYFVMVENNTTVHKDYLGTLLLYNLSGTCSITF